MGFASFRTASTPRRPLAATSSFDHEHKFPSTDEALLAECGHRVLEFRRGLERGTGQGFVGVLLTMIMLCLLQFLQRFELTCIQDSMANGTGCVELGLACADVCRAFDRGMNGRRVEDLSRSVVEAIEQLAT